MSAGARPGFNLSAWALRHRTLTLFFLLLFTLAGVLAYATLGLKEEPEFKFKVMVVRVLWPGATAEEIEQQVTDKLEKKLQDTPHLDYLRSYSRPGESVIFVNLEGHTRARAVDDTWYQVRKKTADVRPELPAGVIGPFFNDEFGDTYTNIYAVTGDGFGYAEVKDYAELLRAELLRVPGVEKVDLLGVQEERVYVEYSQQKLAALGIEPQQLFGALAQQNRVAPAGRVDTGSANLQVRVTGGFESLADIESVALRANGRSFRLGDVAAVRRGYADPPGAQMRHQGREAIGVQQLVERRGEFDRGIAPRPTERFGHAFVQEADPKAAEALHHGGVHQLVRREHLGVHAPAIVGAAERMGRAGRALGPALRALPVVVDVRCRDGEVVGDRLRRLAVRVAAI